MQNQKKLDAYLEKGKTKGELKDKMGALKDFNKAFELKEDFIKRALLKALVYDLDGGLRDADKAKDFYEAQGKIDKYQSALESINEIYNIKNNR